MRESVLSVSRVGWRVRGGGAPAGGAGAGGPSLPALLSVRVRPGADLGLYVADADEALRALGLGLPAAGVDGLLSLRATRRGGVVALRLRHGTGTLAALLVPIACWERDLRGARAVLHDARLVLGEPAGQPAAS